MKDLSGIFYFAFQKTGVNTRSIGKISSLPSSISAERTSFAKEEYAA